MFRRTRQGASDSQLVNSVYFDNRQMQLYHGRMDKTPGAIALRLRWSADRRSLYFFLFLSNSLCVLSLSAVSDDCRETQVRDGPQDYLRGAQDAPRLVDWQRQRQGVKSSLVCIP